MKSPYLHGVLPRESLVRLILWLFALPVASGVMAPLCRLQTASAQTGTLAEPWSPPTANAALHYQRAIIYLQAIDSSQTELLDARSWPDIYQMDFQKMPSELKRLLYQGRLATRCIADGARLKHCDFGIDYRHHGAATPLPHVAPLVRLGRLMGLRACYEASRQNWEESAVILFDNLRLGRHLNQQPTIAESFAGLQIIEDSLYALSLWAVHCPDPTKVRRARRLLETLSQDLTHPARTVTGELSILGQRLDGLLQAYPNGPWAELILEDLGDTEISTDTEENRRVAKAKCIEAGIPAEIFESPQAFSKYIRKVERIHVRFMESAAACMTLPPQAGIEESQSMFETYQKFAGSFGDSLVFNPTELVVAYAKHESNVTLARIALAVASRKENDQLPEDLSAISSLFGGNIPSSPYNSSAVTYDNLGGSGIYLEIPEFSASGATLPQVSFSSNSPELEGGE